MKFILVLLGFIGMPLIANAGTTANAQGKAELLMFEEDGCHFCHRFHKELDKAYAHSLEGKLAPLRVVDLHEPLANGIVTNGSVEVSPTFMLVYDGNEVGRMMGYRGDEFFWVQLQELFLKLPQEVGYTPSI